MFDLRIKNSQVIYLFERNLDIRREIFDYEEILKEHFIVPFKANNVPEEADPNISRFQSTSLNGFSNLRVSQNKLVLGTEYSQDFYQDIPKVKNYLESKISLLPELLERQKLFYMGLVVTIDKEFDPKEILGFIKERTGTCVINDNTVDFRYFYSQQFRENYFLNVQISKFESVSGRWDENRAGEITSHEIEAFSTGIAVIFDFNNKLKFKRNEEFKFEETQEFVNLFFEVIENNGLKNFITGQLQ